MYKQLAVLALAALGTQQASAADWSDTSIGYRYGTKFAEPYNPNDIKKHIVSWTYADGYKYGGNYMNVDFLASAGMGILVVARDELPASVQFAVVADGPATSRPLKLVGISEVVGLHATLDEALAALTA